MFKVGDWVQITPTPDYRWSQWYNSRDIYQEYLDKIGQIEFISEDDERPGEFLYAVKVNFPFGLGNLDPGHYYEWFKEDHLIISSQSNANLRFNMAQAGKELQEWEDFKRKSTDKMLKHIFGQEEKPKNNTDEWNLKTPIMSGDQYDEKYDTYYDDYSSLKFNYVDDADSDYYYADPSDGKKKDTT
jgi:hypothetical protein